MNPIQAFRIWRRSQTLINLVKETHVNKPLWKSKTFWVNILTASADVMGVLPIPAGWSVPTLAILNVILRTISSTPVRVV